VLNDDEAQQRLDNGICPQCGAEILERGEPDDIDGHVIWHAWFECAGKSRHTYYAEKDGIGGRYAAWEGPP